MSRAPAPSSEFDFGSQVRSSRGGWREVRKRERQVQVARRTRGPTESAVASEEETTLVTS
jgi:hypothetical protein